MFMMNRLLKNKKGVTILEGLIALGLLAMVAGGTFGVLLSVSRKASRPDIREEMILAVERANEQLQVYVSTAATPSHFQNGLCGGDSSPLAEGSHDIKCKLPAICDRAPLSSSFTYTVSNSSMTLPAVAGNITTANTVAMTNVKFSITCNGFTL